MAQKSVSNAPVYAYAYYNRGNAYLHLEQYQLGVQDFDKAIQLDPDYALAYNNSCYAYDKLGQDAKAEADKAQACSLYSGGC